MKMKLMGFPQSEKFSKGTDKHDQEHNENPKSEGSNPNTENDFFYCPGKTTCHISIIVLVQIKNIYVSSHTDGWDRQKVSYMPGDKIAEEQEA